MPLEGEVPLRGCRLLLFFELCVTEINILNVGFSISNQLPRISKDNF